MLGLGAAWSLTVDVEGDPDPETGYLLGIDRVDAAVREEVLPWLFERWQNAPAERVSALLPGIVDRLSPRFKVPIRAVELQPEPLGRFRMETSNMACVTLIRQYTFCAAHRLAVPGRSDADNHALYGKCSNPNGHGHNYEVEVAVEVPLADDALDVPGLDQIVDSTLIARFDHKHLNEDLPDFNDRTASVEHITARSRELVEGPISAAGGRLRWITVWETARTACTIQTSANHETTING